MLNRKSTLKRSRIKRVGPLTKKWQKFRNEKAERDKDDDGLLKCQDYMLGLPRCGFSLEPKSMDLHHIKGREEAPELYYSESNLVWLVRFCHRRAHETNNQG